MNIKDFLNDNKESYFKWLKRNCIYFPNCCNDATDILGSFLIVNGCNIKAVKGNKKVFNNRTNYHMWLEADTEDECFIIDFTLFQFYINFRNKFKTYKTDNDLEELYNYCIEEIQRGDVIFSKDYYNNIFNITGAVEFSFIEQAKYSNGNFNKYLELIEKL